MAASLAFLADYDPPTFDVVLDASEPCTDDAGTEAEPHCILCNADVEIFLAYGRSWQHYSGDAAPGSARPYDAGTRPSSAGPGRRHPARAATLNPRRGFRSREPPGRSRRPGAGLLEPGRLPARPQLTALGLISPVRIVCAGAGTSDFQGVEGPG